MRCARGAALDSRTLVLRGRITATRPCVAGGARKKKLRRVDATCKNRDYVTPSTSCLQTRESKNNTTTRSTTRTSARTIIKVDAGSVSLAKRQGQAISKTRDARRGGFFVARGFDSGRTESVPARAARRRLIAGPTPAVSLRTGQF
jgi:hypothetical protein